MKADPDALVAPPQSVQAIDDELVRLRIVDLHETTSILYRIQRVLLLELYDNESSAFHHYTKIHVHVKIAYLM